MKIALVNKSLSPSSNWAVSDIQQRHLGVFPPLSLLFVAALCERAGSEVRIVDFDLPGTNFKQLIEDLKRFKPDLVGMTLYTFNFHETMDFLELVNREVGAKTLVGGPQLSQYPKQTLAHPSIDLAVIGDADVTVGRLLKALEKGEPLDDVPGIAFKKDGQTVQTAPKDPEPDMSGMPLPARHLVPNEKYYSIFSSRKNFTGMITMRACPYQCPYCIHSQKRFAVRTPGRMVEEMAECMDRFGIREFKIYDACFTYNRRRTLEICELLKKRNLDASWWIKTRIDKVDENLLTEMKNAGCTRIDYGIESGEEGILIGLNRGISIGSVKDVVETTKKLGILTTGYFMVGMPGETEKTVESTIRLASGLKLDLAQFCGMIYFPGTRYYEKYVRLIGVDYWAQYTLDRTKGRTLPYLDTPITPERAMSLVRKAYRRFYLRPRRILKVLSLFRSPIQYWRLFLAAAGLIFLTEKRRKTTH